VRNYVCIFAFIFILSFLSRESDEGQRGLKPVADTKIQSCVRSYVNNLMFF